MHSQQGRYFVDAHGRVGRERECGRAEYAYGVLPASKVRHPVKYVSDEIGTAGMEAQRKDMWDCVRRLEPLARSMAARYHRPDTMAFEQLVADIGIPALCYVGVMHRGERGASERTYARRVLRQAYEKERRKRARSVRQAREPAAKGDDIGGLMHVDELQSLGLSYADMQLLLRRYDSEESLEEIARSMGASSRQTALNHLKRIIREVHSKAQRGPPR